MKENQMNLDVGKMLVDMGNVAKESLNKSGAALGGKAVLVFAQNNASIAELISARINGEINRDDFEVELVREKQVLEVQLISQKIASKAAIQKAMNAAISSLASAIAAAL